MSTSESPMLRGMFEPQVPVKPYEPDPALIPTLDAHKLICKWVPNLRGVLHGAALNRFERRQRGRISKGEEVILEAPFEALGAAALRLLQEEFPYGYVDVVPEVFRTMSAAAQERMWAGIGFLHGNEEAGISGFVHLTPEQQQLAAALAFIPSKIDAKTMEANPMGATVVARTMVMRGNEARISVMPAEQVVTLGQPLRVMHPYSAEIREVQRPDFDPTKDSAYPMAVSGLAALPTNLQPRVEIPAIDMPPGATISPQTPAKLLRIGGPPGSIPLPPIEATDPNVLKGLAVLYKIGDPVFNEEQRRRRLTAEAALASQRPQEVSAPPPLNLDEVFDGGQMNLQSFPEEFDAPVQDGIRFGFGRKVLRFFISFGGRCRKGKPEEVEAFMTQRRQEEPQAHVGLDEVREQLSGLGDDQEEVIKPGDHWTELRRSLALFISETSKAGEEYVVTVKNVRSLAKGLYKGLLRCEETKKRRAYSRVALAETHKILETINLLKDRRGKRGTYDVLAQVLKIDEWKEAVNPVTAREARDIELRYTSRRLGSTGLQLYVSKKRESGVTEPDLTKELEFLLQEQRMTA